MAKISKKLRINHVRINRARPVIFKFNFISSDICVMEFGTVCFEKMNSIVPISVVKACLNVQSVVLRHAYIQLKFVIVL